MAKRNRRRPVGRGSVYPERGQWRAQITVAGRRLRRLASTEDAAWEALEELRRATSAGLDIDRNSYTVSDLLADWLHRGEHVKGWTPADLEDYGDIARVHLEPPLGRRRVRELAPRHVQALLADLTRRCSAERIKKIHTALRSALALAMEWEAVDRNVAAQVRGPAVRPVAVEPFALAEARRFVDIVAKDWLGALYILTITIGLRQSEVVGLRWEDVDLANRELHIRRRTYYRRGEFHTGPPKSAKGARTIAFPDQIEQLLRDHKVAQKECILASEIRIENSGLVFTDETGGFLRGSMLTRRMQRILKGEGLPRRTFHQLRHTSGRCCSPRARR